MKKITGIILGSLLLIEVLSPLHGQSDQIIKTIRVGQDLRMVIIFYDKDGIHMQYFTEPRAGEAPKLLGEEIFKRGEKVFDNYTEND